MWEVQSVDGRSIEASHDMASWKCNVLGPLSTTSVWPKESFYKHSFVNPSGRDETIVAEVIDKFRVCPPFRLVLLRDRGTKRYPDDRHAISVAGWNWKSFKSFEK